MPQGASPYRPPRPLAGPLVLNSLTVGAGATLDVANGDLVVDYDGGSSPREGALVLDGLLYGAFYSQDLTAATPLKEILDAFYLFQVPLDLVRAELMIDYAEDGTRKQVIYADGSIVSVDFESLDHEVCVRGRRVLRNWACFAPGSRPGTYLFYRARDDDNTVWPLPPEWAGAAGVAAVALTEAGEGKRHEFAVKDGSVSFDLPTDVPFRVTRLA